MKDNITSYVNKEGLKIMPKSKYVKYILKEPVGKLEKDGKTVFEGLFA
jgi:hypothetical protein